MTTDKIIRALLKERNISMTGFAKKLGYKLPTYISTKLERGNNIRVDNLMKMLEGLDAELVIRSKYDKNEWVIDNEEPTPTITEHPDVEANDGIIKSKEGKVYTQDEVEKMLQELMGRFGK